MEENSTIINGILGLAAMLSFVPSYSTAAQKYDYAMELRSVPLTSRPVINYDGTTHIQFHYKGKTVQKGRIGMTTSKTRPKTIRIGRDDWLLTWPDAELTVTNYQTDKTECTHMSWKAKSCVTEILQDCYNMAGAHWYGGAEMRQQYWPLEKVSQPAAAYVAAENNNHPYGAVQERYFLSSAGVGYFVDHEVPLYVSINSTGDMQLCFQAKYLDDYTYRNYDNSLPFMNYTVCRDSDVLSVHKSMAYQFIPKPDGIPNEAVLRHPEWSTWAQYKKTINQSVVLDLAQTIYNYNLTISQLGIDEMWMTNFGDFTFDSLKFPDAKGMISKINALGIEVITWLPPFINIESPNFMTATSKGYLMKDASGRRPAFTGWWESQTAGLLDFTNPDAVAWFQAQLANLRNTYGVKSFKFDGGDTNYLPPVYSPRKPFRNPSDYCTAYAKAVFDADNAARRHEVRTGYNTQQLPSLIRMDDKSSSWGYSQGFSTILTGGLVFGLIGYPFVLPDMVGGNAYGPYPDAELFVRWMEANALMPAMQMSIVPWRYNDTVIKITQKMFALRQKYADKIVNLAKESAATGAPIMRPLWWIAPTDESALTVDDEFLLGDDLLVAPVMEKQVKSRKIYLPAGQWRDEIHGTTVNGGQWIDFPVTIEDLPHFTKLS